MNDILDNYWDLKYEKEEKILKSSIDSVAKFLLLRLLIRAYRKDPLIKEINFPFRYTYIPLSFGIKISALNDLINENVIEIESWHKNLTEIQQIEENYEKALHLLLTNRKPFFEVKEVVLIFKILKNLNEIDALYIRELKSFQLNIEQFSLLKQKEIVLDCLFRKQQNLGKNLFSFSYDEITYSDQEKVNLFYILLYLEFEKQLTIIGFSSEDFSFQLKLASHLFRGKNYSIDMENCEINFDDGKKVVFKADTQIYKVLDLFIIQQQEKVSDEDFAFAATGNIKVKEYKELAKQNAKRIRGEIRSRNLHTKKGEYYDIFTVEKGYTSLKG